MGRGKHLIRLFGTPSLPGADGSRTTLPQRESEVLAFLALRRQRAHPRGVIAGTLWGDQDERGARKCLSTALWRLRQAIARQGLDPDQVLLLRSPETLQFNAEGPWSLDVERFESAVALLGGPWPPESEALRVAENDLALHRADLLEGFDPGWLVAERERFRLMFINGLAHLMRYYREEDPCRAVELGLEILRFDPLREAVHRELMRLHMATGQRSLALRQYESCRELLREELGVSPMEETRALYLRILHEESSPAEDWWHRDRPGRAPEAEGDPVLRKLHEAKHHIDRARTLVWHALKPDPPPVPRRGRRAGNTGAPHPFDS